MKGRRDGIGEGKAEVSLIVPLIVLRIENGETYVRVSFFSSRRKINHVLPHCFFRQ